MIISEEQIIDILGIGIGPFNLGMAALCTRIPALQVQFIDAKPNFNWHPGLLLPFAKMQIPFFADLVTAADPTSRFSFINYLREAGRLFPFAINESYYPYRQEYNQYCQWIAGQLHNLHFGWECIDIRYDAAWDCYVTTALRTIDEKNGVGKVGDRREWFSRHVVVGIGASPVLPAWANGWSRSQVIRASEYLFYAPAKDTGARVLVVGSGQSGGEIFLDLLSKMDELRSLTWVTRSQQFFPMEVSKLSHELSTPAYIDYFYQLPVAVKEQLLPQQHYLYGGMNSDLIGAIYNELYRRSLTGHKKFPEIMAGVTITRVAQGPGQRLQVHAVHHETGDRLDWEVDHIVCATGFSLADPSFLTGLEKELCRADNGALQVTRAYAIDKRERVFVQHADMHTHGFNSADLGLGAVRSAQILNKIMQQDVFVLPKGKVFQRFR